MVVHAGAGVHSGTLVNALLHRYGKLSTTGGELRPGIVHRLDRYTSGVILVARDNAAHIQLAAQFSRRTVEKVYVALVVGTLKQDAGRIERPIARDPQHRTRMTARIGTGRAAVSDYRVIHRYPRHTLVEVRIGTGRTHQIRVHLSSIGHPIAGDSLYGGPPAPSPPHRFFLHAARIRFVSPATGKTVSIEAPLPSELEHWLTSLL
jgi:23S rRNA pseudouridine1911/1915/1917 synthase